ncbi:unnamed protein product, partial [Rotaria sp. Silwood1]
GFVVNTFLVEAVTVGGCTRGTAGLDSGVAAGPGFITVAPGIISFVSVSVDACSLDERLADVDADLTGLGGSVLAVCGLVPLGSRFFARHNRP